MQLNHKNNVIISLLLEVLDIRKVPAPDLKKLCKYKVTSPISKNRIIFSYFKIFSAITCIFGEEKEKKTQGSLFL